MKKLAELWEKVEPQSEKKVRCKVCAHYCIISPGKRGMCKTRENIDGQLFTLIYNSLSSTGSIDPIEKKPLYHFYPGSNAYSIATIGCNFFCKHCQNWEISRSYPDETGQLAQFTKKDAQDFHIQPFHLSEITAEETVNRAMKSNSTSIAYTYNEPTIWFEYIKECGMLAHENGIKNVLVSNGYSSPEANKELANFIDAANIDIKGFSDKFYKDIVGIDNFQPVLETCKFFMQHGILVEITNLIIPNENDSLEEIKALAEWVYNELGPNTPLHFSAYRSQYRLNHQRTSNQILEKAYDIAKKTGLYYVYLGNVLSSKGQDTQCFKCGHVLIHREGYQTSLGGLGKDNICEKCGTKNFIEGKYIKSKRSHYFR